MLRLMLKDDAPAERYATYGFPPEGEVSEEEIRRRTGGRVFTVSGGRIRGED